MTIKERNRSTKIGSKVLFQTGLGWVDSERITHTGTVTQEHYGFWIAVSDLTGEAWELKEIEIDWRLI